MMFEGFFVYGASARTALWGIAHVVPTALVVWGVGEITADNKRSSRWSGSSRRFPHSDCWSGSDGNCDRQMPQLVDALYRPTHPPETDANTESVGGAA